MRMYMCMYVCAVRQVVAFNKVSPDYSPVRDYFVQVHAYSMYSDGCFIQWISSQLLYVCLCMYNMYIYVCVSMLPLLY